MQIRANGLCVVKIADIETFLKEVIGTDSAVEADEIAELLRRVISMAFSDMVLETGLGAIDLQGQQVALSGKLAEFVQERVDDEFGLEIPEMTMNISLPDEITQAMTRGVAKGVEASGFVENVDLNKYQQAQAADAMLAAAENEGGSVMGDMMQMGMGAVMAGQMAQSMPGMGGNQQVAPHNSKRRPRRPQHRRRRRCLARPCITSITRASQAVRTTWPRCRPALGTARSPDRLWSGPTAWLVGSSPDGAAVAGPVCRSPTDAAAQRDAPASAATARCRVTDR